MAELNSLTDVLELCRGATPETVSEVMKQVQPAVVELALSEVELAQVFAALKKATGATLSALRRDFSTYLKANGLVAEQDPSVGTKLVNLALESGVELWHDPERNPWVTLSTNGHAEHHPLKSKTPRRFLTHLYFQATGNAPHAQGLQDAWGTLEPRSPSTATRTCLNRSGRRAPCLSQAGSLPSGANPTNTGMAGP